MAQMTLTKTRIQAGTYEAMLTCDEPGTDPDIGAYLGERPIGALSVIPSGEDGLKWEVQLEIPADILTDGVQTFLMMDNETGTTLDSFAILTGEPLADDLRGEIDLLRAELDMLKKAFRRHCVETN